MLTKLQLGDVPGITRRANPNKAFAVKQIKDFIALNCDAAEVTEFPITQCAESYSAHLKAAVKEESATSSVRVMKSDGRVFLIRER